MAQTFRRSARIIASRKCEAIVKCGIYYTDHKDKCTTPELAEFIYLAEYFMVAINKIPAGMNYDGLSYICRKFNKIFCRILKLYENDAIYELTRTMVFYRYYKRPFMTQNIMNTVKMLLRELPHNEYEDAPYIQKLSLETNEAYYNRLRQTSNIEDNDNIQCIKDTSTDYIELLLKYENIREMIVSLTRGQLKVTTWIPVHTNVISLVSESKEIDSLEDIKINYFANITKETIASSLKGLTKKTLNGREHLGNYIQPNVVMAPREFSIMNVRMRYIEEQCISLGKWYDYYKGTIPEVAKVAADKYIGEDCPICMEKITDAKLLCCGHFYCAECFKRIPKCAVCRISIRK